MTARLDRILIAVYFGILVISFAAIVVVLLGNGRPYVSPDRIPLGPTGIIVCFAILLVVGFFGIERLSKTLWHRAARGADLSPIDDIEDDTYPTYADTRQGNPVRATVVSNRDGNTGYAITKVEALLSTRQKSGVAVHPEDAGGITTVTLDDAVRRNGVAVASDDPNLVHHVATQINAQVVSAPDRIGQIFAGDTHAVIKPTSDPSGLTTREARVVQRVLPRSESGEGVETIRNEFGAFGEVVHDEVAGLETSTATVVHYTAGPVFDSDELKRHALVAEIVGES